MGIAHLFDMDIAAILAALPALDDAWDEERWRQTMPYTPHRDSETIFLRRQPGSRPRDVLHQLASVATRHYACAPLAGAIDEVCRFVQGRPARAMLVRLAPGGVIAEHTDEGIYAEATERFHIALVTSPGAWFAFGNEKYHVPAGMVAGFDKHVPHSGANEGAEPRVHLIVDAYTEASSALSGFPMSPLTGGLRAV